jgi:hypothetical protein
MKQDLIPLRYIMHEDGKHCAFWKYQSAMMRKYRGLHTAARMTETLGRGEQGKNRYFQLDLLLCPVWTFDLEIKGVLETNMNRI